MSLQRFYADESTREEVKQFLIECVKGYGVDRMLAREDVSGVADAKKIIEEAFSKLKETYGKEPKGTTQNPAR
jgi:hypothetical protein